MKDAVAATAGVKNQGQRVLLARIVRDSAVELLLTFLMLFGVISIVRWVIGPSPISQMMGGSVNPARQFGPATLSGQTDFLWVYLVAPMVGALLATWFREIIQRRRDVLTHRLCGTNEDGSAISE